MTEFKDFGKIARISRECVITEKIDGTNAQIFIGEDGEFLTGSRNRWITPDNDNQGFSRWAHEHKDELMRLGPGRHFGEWWGKGIQRGYGAPDKRFSLFNASAWTETPPPSCCLVVPVLYVGEFTTEAVNRCIDMLKLGGSRAIPFMDPEGIVVYHTAARVYFKKTIENDESPKSRIGNGQQAS